MLKSILVLCLVSISMGAFGWCYEQGCDTTVKRVYASADANGKIYLQPDEASLSAVNCTPTEGVFFVLKQDHKLYSEIYSMALASVMSGKNVRMRIKENTNDCELLYMWVWK